MRDRALGIWPRAAKVKGDERDPNPTQVGRERGVSATWEAEGAGISTKSRLAKQEAGIRHRRVSLHCDFAPGGLAWEEKKIQIIPFPTAARLCPGRRYLGLETDGR